MWEISVNGQISTALYSVLCGSLLSFVFDIMSAAVFGVSKSRIVLFISDVFFWIFSAFLIFVFLISRTNGEIRGYVLFSCAVGFMLYRATLRRIVFPLLNRLFSFILFVCNKSAKVLALACDGFEKILGFIGAKVRKTCLKVSKRAKKLLKSVFGMLYTDRNSKNLEYDENE